MSFTTNFRAFLFLGALVLSGCEKPRLRSHLADQESSEKSAPPPGEKVVAKSSAPEESERKAPKTMLSPELPTPAKPQLSPQALANEIARRKSMLDAQLAGIRNLESDLARHSAVLTSLRGQLSGIQAREAHKKSGGIFVERIGGQSSVVNRGAEIQDLKGKIQAEEQIVAQLNQSLQGARSEYQRLRVELDNL